MCTSKRYTPHIASTVGENTLLSENLFSFGFKSSFVSWLFHAVASLRFLLAIPYTILFYSPNVTSRCGLLVISERTHYVLWVYIYIANAGVLSLLYRSKRLSRITSKGIQIDNCFKTCKRKAPLSLFSSC